MKRPLLLLLVCSAVGAAGGAAFRVFREKNPAPTTVIQPETRFTGKESAANPARRTGTAKSGTTSADSPHAVGKLSPRPILEELRAAPKEDRLRLLVRWLPKADATEVAALAQEWFPKALGGGDGIWQVLVQRWVEVDAPTAISYSRKLATELLNGKNGGNSSSGNTITPLDYTYRALGRVDPDLALSLLAEEPAPVARRVASEFRQSLGAEKMRQWAMDHKDRSDLAFLVTDPESKPLDLSDPAKAAASLTPEQLKNRASSIAAEWAKKDPDAAVAWANSLEYDSAREESLTEITKTLLKTNPEKAREIIESMPSSSTQAKAGADYAGNLAKTDPAAAMTWLDKNLKGAARLQGIARIASARAESDPEGALRLLRENGVSTQNSFLLVGRTVKSSDQGASSNSTSGILDRALRAISAHDPAGAMQFLADNGSIDPGIFKMSSYVPGYLPATLFKDWTDKDPAAAARWVASQPVDETMRILTRTAAAPWFATNPAEVRAFAASLPEGAGREAFVQSTATLMAAGDPNSALVWTTQNGSAETLAAVYLSIVGQNPEAAAEHFGAMPETVQSAQLNTLVCSLGQRVPVEAARFYESLPPERQAAVHLGITAKTWAKQDPQAASEWITALPPTEAKDTAISGLVEYLLRDAADPDPQSAAYWAAASLTPDTRYQRLSNVAEAWYQRDPNAATDIRGTTLPDDVKQFLLRRDPSRQPP